MPMLLEVATALLLRMRALLASKLDMTLAYAEPCGNDGDGTGAGCADEVRGAASRLATVSS